MYFGLQVFAPRGALVEGLEDVAAAAHRLRIQRRDHIAQGAVEHWPQPRLLRRAIGHHTEDDDAWDLQGIGDAVRGEGDAQKAPRHKALLQNQLHVPLHSVHRDRQAHPCGRAAGRQDGLEKDLLNLLKEVFQLIYLLTYYLATN